MHSSRMQHGSEVSIFSSNLRADGLSIEEIHQLPPDDPEVKKAVAMSSVQTTETVGAVTCMIHFILILD